MKANLPQNEPKRLETWAAMGIYERDPRRLVRTAEVRPPRRPSVRERPHPHRPRAEQDPQGRRREVADDDGLRLAVRPGWDCHGLPIEHQVDKELGSKKREMSPAEFRRACREFADKFRRHPARGLQAARRVRRLGRSVLDDVARLRGRRSPRPSARSSRRGSSTKGSSRSTGARTARRRSPRRRSSTRSTPRLRCT